MRARHLQALAAITIAGAVLRFATLDVQSYWLDEAATVNLLHKGFGAMLSGVSAGESTPPLYYIVAWVWAKIFGTHEAALRSLSALFGTAAVPLAFALGRRVAGQAAGLVAAGLCAFNPLLVWYSQEARSYALLILLAGVSLVAMLDAAERPAPRRLALWAAVCVAALATHYFAGFLAGAEALWLLHRLRDRRQAAMAAAAVGVAAAALLPLALHQHATGAAKFISESSLARRLVQIPKQFAIGYQGPLELVLTIVAGLVIVFAIVRLVAAAAPQSRHRAALLAGLAMAVLGASLALAAVGQDFVLTRNVVASLLPLLVVLAAGFAAPRARGLGTAAAVVLGAIGLVVVIAVNVTERYQRDNWRGAARALGRPTRPRAIVVTPASGITPLTLYLRGARPVGPHGVDVRELDFVGLAPRLPGEAPKPPRPGQVGAYLFTEFARRQSDTYTVVREFGGPYHITGTVGASSLDGRPAIVLYQR